MDFLPQVTEVQVLEQYRLRVQQLRADAEDGLRRAKMMIASNNYQGAIAVLEIVNNLIRFAP